MNQENKHFVSFSIINKRKNILCKRFYSSFDQNSRLLNVFVSFRNRISSISKLYYRRTFMIVDIPRIDISFSYINEFSYYVIKALKLQYCSFMIHTRKSLLLFSKSICQISGIYRETFSAGLIILSCSDIPYRI